jgi:hypothetical protein
MIDVFQEVIRDLKAQRQTEFYWCKCSDNCQCDHCRPDKLAIGRNQLKEIYEDAVKLLESGKWEMRNQQHTLSLKTIKQIYRKVLYDEQRRNRIYS